MLSVIPNDMEIEITDSCPLSFEEIEIIDNFTITGNGGFQYQGKEKNGNDDFHFGINRVSKGKPFSNYHINIKLNTNSYNYFAESSYFSQYIFDDEEKLEEMQELFSQSNFVLNCADNLLFYLFGEADSFENFKEIINLFSLVLGPKVVNFYPLDERDFYVEAEHLFINCPDCYITCYDKIQPIDVNAPIIVSADECKVMKLPPVDDEPPPANIDPLNYIIQNYPAIPLTPAPPVEPGAIIEPMPNDDAWHTSLWLPCQGDLNLKTAYPYSLIEGSKGVFSTYCVDKNPNDDVQGYFYRVTEDWHPNGEDCSSNHCKHEMFEVLSDGIYLRREILYDYYCYDEETNQSGYFDYRHHNSFKWFPRYVSVPMIFVEAHDEFCWMIGDYSMVDPCIGLQFSTNSYHIRNNPMPSETAGNKIVIIKKDQFSMPDPINSKDPSYCVWNYTNCPSDAIEIILNQNKKICYLGPKRVVNAIVMQFYLGGMGLSNYGQCGIEKYYYAKDIDDPSITWGYVYYEYIPYSSECPPESRPSQGLFYKNEVFSTPYPPDLKPYIPKSAEEKH